MNAAEEGKPETVSLLLKHEADTLLRDSEGKTATDYALENGHQTIVELLAKR